MYLEISLNNLSHMRTRREKQEHGDDYFHGDGDKHRTSKRLMK